MPDYAGLARAYGALGFTAESEERARRRARRGDRVAAARAVVDARVDPREHCFPMIPAGAAALDLVEFDDTQTEVTA